MYVCMCVCMHVCMYLCIYVCMYVCMYLCMYVCMYVCIFIFIFTHDTHVYTYNGRTHTHTGFSLTCLAPDLSRISTCKRIRVRNNVIVDVDASLFWDKKYKMQFHRGLIELDLACNKWVRIVCERVVLCALSVVCRRVLCCICVYSHAHKYICVHGEYIIHRCVHADHTCIHVCMQAYVHVYVCGSVSTCMHI